MVSETKSEAEKAAEMGRSAAEYCKNIRTEIPNIEEASADSIVWNLRFMAYCAGYRAGSAWAAPKWISVKERLPEVEGEYWTYSSFTTDLSIDTFEDGTWWKRDCWDIWEESLGLTHWANIIVPAAPEVEK